MADYDVYGAAGLRTVHVTKVNSDGLAVGQSTNPESPTANSVLQWLAVNHPINANPGNVSRRTVEWQGGGTSFGKLDIGVDAIDDGELTVSLIDARLTALATGVTTNDTYNTGITHGGLNPVIAVPIPVQIAIVSGAQDFTPDGSGAAGFEVKLYRGTLAPNDPPVGTDGGVNPNPHTYTFTKSKFSKLSNGVLLSTILSTVQENIVHPMRLAYPMDFVTWVANGSASSFTLPYLPVSSDADGDQLNWIVKVDAGDPTGAIAAVTSVNTSTGLVTLSAAGNAGDMWHVWYAHNNVLSS